MKPDPSQPALPLRHGHALHIVGWIVAIVRWSMTTAPVLAASLVLIAWVVGRVVSDRWLWSQYLAWLPAAVVLGVAAVMLVVSVVGVRMMGTRRLGRSLRRLATIGLIVVAGIVLIGDWHAHRLVLGAPSGQAPKRDGTWRLVSWNLASVRVNKTVVNAIPDDADLVILSNVVGVSSALVIERLAGLKPAGAVSSHQIYARWPIIDSASVSLDLQGVRWKMSVKKHGKVAIDDGRLAYVTLDASARLGRPLTIWIVDLPSDPKLSRWTVLTRVAERAIDFPTPDLILGDFNTPRGSRSIRLLTGSLTEAHHLGGIGPGATWPRKRPFWAIDLTFVSDRFVVVRHTIVDPGRGWHRFQVTDLLIRD